ncbi:MAG: hypothetical protein K6E32_10055 [Lachnospiraceae bacterium]|nr:hypothetical protein [Lachnospiraceae bacterium]
MLGLIIFFVLVIVFFVTVVAVWAIRTTDPNSDGVIHLTKPKMGTSHTTIKSAHLEGTGPIKRDDIDLEKMAREDGLHYSRTIINTTVDSKGNKTVTVQDTEMNRRIKCKFCGYEINVDKNDTCPQCGATYDMEEVNAATQARIQKILEKQEQPSEYKKVY